MSVAGETPARPIRSFVLRQGRVSAAQQRAYDTLMPRFGIAFQSAPLDLNETFGRDAPKILEIGFGMGETTAHMAGERPDQDFLALEVHTPGVGALLKTLAEQDIPNVRIIQHDAVEVAQAMLAPASLDSIHIFFPDPWPKKRHHKRRLIQPDFIALLATRLKTGATVHAATDWEEYASHILAVLAAEPSLENTANGYAPRPAARPQTKFERRGLKLGHPVFDIIFRKRKLENSD